MTRAIKSLFHASCYSGSRAGASLLASLTFLIFSCALPAMTFNGDTSDPRSLALGSAGLADPTGVEAFHLNPAALGYLKDHREISAVKQILDENSQGDRVTYGQHIRPGGAIGMTLSQLVEESIQERDDQGVLKGYFDYRQREMNFGYGWMPSPRIALGGAWKYRSTSYPGARATGRAIDLGLMADLASTLRCGLVLGNLDSSMKSDTDLGSFSKSLDQKIGMGLSWKHGLTRINFSVGKQESDTWRFRAGVEKGFGEALALRAGWDSDNLTLGCGFRVKNMFFDYAYVPGTLESQALVSMKLKFYRLDLFRELDGGKAAPKRKPVVYEAQESPVNALSRQLSQALEAQDVQTAEAVLLKLTDLEPEKSSWKLRLADLRIKRGDLEGARLIFQNLASRSLDPGTVGQARRAIQEIDSLLFRKASAELSEQGMPQAAAGEIALAELAMAEKKYASAIVNINRAMATLGSTPILLLKRAMAQAGVGDIRKAVEDLEHLLSICDDVNICSQAALLLERIRGEEQKAPLDETSEASKGGSRGKSPGEIAEGI